MNTAANGKANNYRVVDRRPQFTCACRCGTSATLTRLKMVSRHGINYLVLREHEERLNEILAAQQRFTELLRPRRPWLRRLAAAREVHFINRTLGVSKLLTFRSTIIFASPKWMGLLIAKLWPAKPR